MRAKTFRRLAAIESERHAARAGLVVKTWLASYRAGADVYERNLAAGPAWVAMALERHRLAEQTMVDYADENTTRSLSGG